MSNYLDPTTIRVLIMAIQESNAIAFLNGKLNTGQISIEAYNRGLDYVAQTNGNIILKDVVKSLQK